MSVTFLFIPEGVSVATVIIDGVDVAPAGWGIYVPLVLGSFG
jgi:hypothetical protein